MRRHLAKGKEDSRKVTYEYLKRAGVPLDIPRSEGQYRRSARHDQAYVLNKLHELMQTHPDISLEEQLQERRRLRQ